MRAASSPGAGGDASKWLMIEKRIRAQRSRIGGSFASLIVASGSEGGAPPIADAKASTRHGS